jgi:ArsR family transcriptional regulator, arsenate/arsenite/antimonite-responsive transcriptional repressor
MRKTVKAFKSLSDETRLRVLNLILERECCVCEVMQALEISQSKASRHLSALYDAGFLKQRKEGLWSLYCMDESMDNSLSDMVSAVRKSLTNNPDAKMDRERLKTARRTSVPCAPCSTKAVPITGVNQ